MSLPYTTWKIGEVEHKLRLTTRQAVAVEEKLGVNLLKVFMPRQGEDFPLPPLKVMLVVIHGALQKFEHGTTLDDVYDMNDDYVDAGGDQTSLLMDVIIPLFENSGFMPKQKETTDEQATLTTVK
ncbi:DUF6096 family protein [Streptococcus gallolyticus]|jgi:hypothetical protein|uniref:DUF6096 family protein n=1 Tax=Streptococcus gallolyticus TaxID=315405 RepID=UPI00205804F5|nr:DUF6096 family protein [Streptococcus gallolyticus]WAW99475.1 DUF6096 family protein [Streptococcus gallolyticus]DAV14634.1 MAG TPA: tail assembly chaperone [Caudoviricetes sp.]